MRVKNCHGIPFILVLVFIMVLTACQSEPSKSVEEDPPENTEQQPAEQEADPQEPSNIDPLTGVATNEAIDHRVIGVMVNNHPKARPQSGLHKADVIYEVLAEGWVTRFLALYQSEMPEIVGPVRSARDYYVALSNGYNAFYIHHGWSPGGKNLINTSDTDNLNGLYYDGTLFTRVDFRSAPHNSYITYDNMVEGAEDKGYDLKADVSPLPFYNKEEINALKGEKASEVSINYDERYSVRYTYNSSSNTYERFSDGEQTIDRKTQTPITVSNVFIIEAPHRVIDSAGRRAINFEDGGRALLLQQGVMREVTWKNEDGRIVPQGAEFLPGKTWINVIPDTPGIDNAVKTMQ